MPKSRRLSVRKTMCSTCPFRTGGYEHIRPLLEERARTEASPICHSTGGPQAVVPNNVKSQICRGARTYQEEIFYRLGVLDAPTDAAWEARCQEWGL